METIVPIFCRTVSIGQYHWNRTRGESYGPHEKVFRLDLLLDWSTALASRRVVYT